MKLPRSVSGAVLVKALRRVGYSVSRQTGSHLRLTREVAPVHHVTIPNHDALSVGTLSAILGEIARHLEISKDDLIRKLF